MRRLTTIAFLLCPLLLAAQAPIWRNSWSTNQSPPVIGTNLGVSNTASGFMWKFYGWPDSNMVARLSDVTNIVGGSSASITNAVASVWTNGSAVVASGATNIEFFGVVASNAPVGQIGNVRVWIQPSSGTNVNFFFVTNGLYASNVFATNLSVDVFYVNTEMQLSNALRVPFGGTGTNTNVLGAFFIGNGTNSVQFLNTNTFANWLSNQMVSSGLMGDFIPKSNGFGTNLSLLGYFHVGNSNLTVTNLTTVWAAVGIRTNLPKATLHIWSEAGRHFLLIGSNATTPTLTITNSSVGIGRPDPREALDLRGNLAVSGSAGISNGLYVEVGLFSLSGLTNLGTAVFTNSPGSGNATTVAINTNGAGGIAVLHIAAGTNGMVAPYRSPTNQYVILYTNVMYGTGFAVETNGRVTANTFVGAGISAQGLTVTTNGTDYISTTNLYFIGQPKITNASGDVSIDITPGAASTGTNFPLLRVTNGAWIGTINAGDSTLTNVGLFGNLASFASSAFSNIVTMYDVDNGSPLFVADMTEGVQIVDFEGGSERWIFGTNDDNPQMPIRRKELTNVVTSGLTNFGTATFNGDVSATTNLSVGGVMTGTNGLSLPLANTYPTTNDLFNSEAVAGGTNSTWRWYNSNSILYLETAVGTSKKSVVINTNGATSLPASLTTAGSIVSGGDVRAANASFLAVNVTGVSSACKIGTSTNGTTKFFDNTGVYNEVGISGSTILLDPVARLPFPAASKGVLTNGQYGIGNTNGTITFMTSTNGTNRSDMMGVNASNLWVQTQMEPNQPIACYGAMMMPLTNILAVGPTAYTNVNGYSVLNTNWFACNTNTGTISNVFAGYYRITIDLSALAGNNETLEGCLLTNGVDSECISFYKQYDAAARWDSFSRTGTLYLPANCQCSLGIKTTTAGNIAIRRAGINIGTP